MFGIDPTEITSFTYLIWTFVALFVSIAAANILFQSFRDRKILSKSGMLLVLGICLSWGGEALNKGWFGTWRIINHSDYDWMRNHYMVWVATLLVVFGGLIHFQTLAAKVVGRYAAAYALGTAFVLALIINIVF